MRARGTGGQRDESTGWTKAMLGVGGEKKKRPAGAAKSRRAPARPQRRAPAAAPNGNESEEQGERTAKCKLVRARPKPAARPVPGTGSLRAVFGAGRVASSHAGRALHALHRGAGEVGFNEAPAAGGVDARGWVGEWGAGHRHCWQRRVWCGSTRGTPLAPVPAAVPACPRRRTCSWPGLRLCGRPHPAAQRSAPRARAGAPAPPPGQRRSQPRGQSLHEGRAWAGRRVRAGWAGGGGGGRRGGQRRQAWQAGRNARRQARQQGAGGHQSHQQQAHPWTWGRCWWQSWRRPGPRAAAGPPPPAAPRWRQQRPWLPPQPPQPPGARQPAPAPGQSCSWRRPRRRAPRRRPPGARAGWRPRLRPPRLGSGHCRRSVAGRVFGGAAWARRRHAALARQLAI